MAEYDIYPTHFLDNSRSHKNLLLAWTLRFNDVLDGEKLNDALWQLLEIGDWRKLGGRLRMDKQGKLEMHVPKVFTKEYPPVYFTSESFDLGIEEHPLARELPTPTENVSLQRPASDFRSLSTRTDAPRTLTDLISKDIPQMSLHVVSFNDATLVSVSWPHALMDGMSLQSLLKSWSLVLAGKNEEVAPLLGAKEDLIYTAASPQIVPKEPWIMGEAILTGFAFFLFVVRFLWNILTQRTIECRTICFPRAIMARLRQKALEEAAEVHRDKEDPPWLSEGDVILAWGAKIVAMAQPSPRPMNGLCPLDLRPRLPELAGANGVFIQNAVACAGIQLSKAELKQPLGFIASKWREALTTQTTPSQVRSFLCESRKLWDSGKDPSLVPGLWNGELFTVTNWTKGNFVNVADFSPAVSKTGQSGEKRSNRPGTMVYHQSFVLGNDATMRNVIGVVGKDCWDNYWMTGYFSPRTWAVMEREIETLSRI
ncbi:transferase family domain-containing protein [Pochonia chlamydosporia 170]|uniref:Transferase family domain-containing protein n=1 Tax=Pochonia chlamydosporia 170 TaxID=1380566 RepID=A0A179FWD1_METCM|nr:transferase family domain-containing protein [Pochonia chlamydosporia 170]OAQ69677.1 transferase family domain-containing protein [Pochonia chlamydosporia 170]